MSFYFTSTSFLYDVTVNSSATEVTVVSTSRPVTLYTNATIIQQGGGGITSATFTTLTATNIVLNNSLNGGQLFPSTIELSGPTYNGQSTIQTDAGDVLIQSSGVGDGNLYVQGNIYNYNSKFIQTGIETSAIYQSSINIDDQRQLDSWAVSAYDTAKYFVKVKNGSSKHIVEIVLSYDGTNILKSEYGVITNNGSLGTFTADVTGGNVRLLFTPSGASNMSVRIAKTLMAV